MFDILVGDRFLSVDTGNIWRVVSVPKPDTGMYPMWGVIRENTRPGAFDEGDPYYFGRDSLYIMKKLDPK